MTKFKKNAKMLRQGVLVGAMLFLCVSCSLFPSNPPTPKKISEISELETYINQLIDAGKTPGMSLTIVKGANVIYSKGFGKADGPRNQDANPETVYHWWSITKLFTAVAILQLQEQGRLRLDDAVDQYLPYFKVKAPSKESRKVTIRDLLSHSSGLPDAGNAILGWIHFEGDRPLNQSQMLQEKLPDFRKLRFEPGTDGQYTNIGFMVLAGIIEAVSEESYEDYVSQHILRPLEMEHTGFVYTDEMKPYEAAGSHPKDFMSFIAQFLIDMDRAVREKSEGRYWFNHIYSDQTAPTGLIGSTQDMSHFLIALLNGGEFQGTRILSPQSVQLMESPIVEITKSPAGKTAEMKFALPWFYYSDEGRIELSHGGAGMGFVGMVRLYPKEKLAMVVLANSTYLDGAMGGKIVDLAGSLDWP